MDILRRLFLKRFKNHTPLIFHEDGFISLASKNHSKFANFRSLFQKLKTGRIFIAATILVLIMSVIYRERLVLLATKGADPVAYWKFNEGIGSTVNGSGTANINAPLGRDIPSTTPLYIGKGTFTQGTEDISVPVPSNYQEGDLLVLFVESSNQTISTPSGWTQIPNSPQGIGVAGSSTGIRIAAFYKVASAFESNVTVTDAGDHTTGITAAFRNVDAVNPINASAGNTSGSTTNILFPSITTTLPNTMVINVLGINYGSSTFSYMGSATNTSLTNLTERHDQAAGAGQGGGIGFFTGIKETAGSTGSTDSGSAYSAPRAYLTFALNLGSGWGARPTWKTSEECFSGNCLYFDGSEDAITIGNTEAINFNSGLSSEFTFSTWVRTISDGLSNAGEIFDKGSNTYLRVTNEGSDGYADLEASLDLASTDATVTVTDGIVLNTWQHISLTYSDDGDDEIEIYIDGMLRGTSSNGVGSPATDNTDLLIGGESAYFHGYIDEVKIYNYVRSANQIKGDYTGSSVAGSSAVLGQRDQSSFTNGLISYWKMDESSWGTVTDSSGNLNNGTPVGGVTVGGGKYGNGGLFDGVNDYVSVTGLNGDAFPTQGTISLWFKIGSSSGWDNYNAILSGQALFTRNNLFGIQKEGTLATSTLRIDFANSGGDYTTLNSNMQFSANSEWIHATVVWDQTTSTASLYINGELDNVNANITTWPSQFNNWQFGKDRTYTDRNFGGSIDEVRVYNRAFDSSEAKALYGLAPGPVGYWKMDEGRGRTTVDSSGNGYDGTLGDGSSTPAWKNGKFGNGLAFDGNDIVVGSHSPFDFENTTFTVSAWIKVRDEDINDTVVIASEGGTSGGWLFGIDGNIGNDPYILLKNASSNAFSADTDNAVNVADGRWHYVSAIITTNTSSASGNSVYFYVDGLKYTGSDVPSLAYTKSSLNWSLGSRGAGTDTFLPGSIDDIKIYNYARTAPQIMADMNADHPVVGTPVGSTVLHLKMDEGYGSTVNDSSPQRNNGTIAGNSAPTWTNEGKFGRALSFDGGDYINVGAFDEVEGSSAITLSFWAKQNSHHDSSYISKNSNDGVHIQSWSDQKIYFAINGATNRAITGAGVYPLNEWYHVVGTYDGSTIKIYVNGIQKASSAKTTTIPSDSAILKIGGDTAEFFNGTMDEVKIYPFALTTEEVHLEYNQGKGFVMGAGSTGVGGTSPSNSASRAYCPPGDTSVCLAPVGEWNMEENAGTSSYDTSGNNNTGILTNGPKWTVGYKGIGSAVQLDGIDNNVVVTNNSVLNIGTSDFTLSTWIKGRNMANADVIFAKTSGGGCSSTYGFHFSVYDSLYPTLHFCTAGGSHAKIQGTTTLSNNEWYHINVVVDRDSSSNSKVYINGVLAPTTVSNLASHTGSITNSVNLAIGSESDGESYFDGVIDQVKIYNYARTPAQVAWEFNRGLPVAHYKLDECTGTTIYDSAENNLNGTLSLGSGGTTSAGTCTTSGAWSEGAVGKKESSLSFDGSDDYVDMGDNLEYPIPVTVSAWIKANSLTSVGAPIFVNDKTTTTNSGIWFLINQNGSLNINYGDNTGTESSDRRSKTSAAGLITTGTWYHVAGVIRGQTDMDLYINGRIVDGTYSGTGGATIGYSTRTARIGMVGNTQNLFFNGQIDDVKLFNYALTPAQIKTEMAGGAVRFQ